MKTAGRWIALLALVPSACTTPLASPWRPLEPETEASSPPTTRAPREVVRAKPRRASGAVDVLLYRGAGPVEIEGTQLVRSSAGIRSARGAELGASALFTGLFDGRDYPGQLLVRTHGDGLEVRNRVDLEDYVAGVLAAELVLWSARPAELEAQAVVARSYAVAALSHRGATRADPYLFGDVRDQAYRGRVSAEYRTRVNDAVRRTRGQVLVEDGRVVHARFHAACGGATADGRAVFPELDFDCMRPVACAPCAAERPDLWRATSSRATLEATAVRLGLGRSVTTIAPASRDPSGRWLTVRVEGDAGSRVVPFQDLRMSLGPAEVQSTRVVRTWPHPGQRITDGFFIEGHGRGHGVGLCQTGTKGYAAGGWSAERILAHYYAGATVVDRR